LGFGGVKGVFSICFELDFGELSILLVFRLRVQFQPVFDFFWSQSDRFVPVRMFGDVRPGLYHEGIALIVLFAQVVFLVVVGGV
jgi:hypothetical protein